MPLWNVWKVADPGGCSLHLGERERKLSGEMPGVLVKGFCPREENIRNVEKVFPQYHTVSFVSLGFQTSPFRSSDDSPASLPQHCGRWHSGISPGDPGRSSNYLAFGTHFWALPLQKYMKDNSTCLSLAVSSENDELISHFLQVSNITREHKRNCQVQSFTKHSSAPHLKWVSVSNQTTMPIKHQPREGEEYKR